MELNEDACPNESISIYTSYLKRKHSENQDNTIVDIREETDRYFNAKLINPQIISAITFWKVNKENFPVLSAMAKDYLTVQASSVEAERAFSSGVDLVTPERCSLGGETIEMVQFLKFNL